jgi:hypothetical protein
MAADQFTKVTRTGWGQNIFNSFIGALIGVLLFFGSFVVLWMNEGKTNWAQVASTSTSVESAAVNPSTDGKFVATTGALVSGEQLGDAPYLEAGPYLKLDRQVEMFAWVENEKSESKDELGGGTTTKTTYTYTKEWTSNPEDSDSFEVPSGHSNPQQRVEDGEWTVGEAKVGAYTLDPAQLSFPSTQAVRLNSEMIPAQSPGKLVGEYLFDGRGTLQNPQLGDLRITYAAVPNNTQATVFGTQSGSAITPYLYRGEDTFYRAIGGNRAQAIDQLETEHNVLTWILRLVGFLMMWFGMSMVLGPITAFLKVLPFLGSLSGFAIGAMTFGIALALTVITVIIAIIAHSLIALIILLVLFFGGLFLWSKQAENKKVAAAG